MKVTVDIVLFGYVEGDLKLLLIQRKYNPYINQWALPGGFIKQGESIEAAVKRELAEETGITSAYTEQLYTFGEPTRDPREHIISVAYYGLIKPDVVQLKASTDATDARWFSCKAIPTVAFDHEQIYKLALQRLQAKLTYQPVGFELLPERFTIRDLQTLYEAILDKTFDQSNFSKKILRLGILDKMNEKEENVANRPAALYCFNSVEYDKKIHSGFYFEIRHEK